jgi:hypothetical protein
MAGSTAAVLMSPGYGGYQTATLPLYYATTGCFTTKAPEFHAVAYDAYELHHQRACQLTEVSKYYTTKSPECYTATYAALAYCTEVPTNYNNEARKFYTATYAAPSHYTLATKYYSA